MSNSHGPGTEKLLLIAVESSPSGLLMTDSTGTIVLVNRQIERLFGYTREELLGQPVEVLVPAARRVRHAADRTDYAAHATDRPMGMGRDIVGLHKDGSEIPLEVGLTPVTTPEGMIVVSAIADISARKQAEAEQRRLERELHQAQKLEALGTLAAGVAHDFNNVLAAITGYGELVRDRAQDPDILADVNQILAEAARGRQIVGSVMRHTRSQPSERVLTDLAIPIREVAAWLRMTIASTIEIQLDLAPETPSVVADGTAVHRILVNLCNNATQAMAGNDDRQRPRSLTISLRPRNVDDALVHRNPELHVGPYALLEVVDTGDGIPPEAIEHLFEPFFTTKAPEQGTGLGLPTVRSLLQDHGGAIEVESEVDYGTRVRCFFPADVALPSAIVPAPRDAARPGGGELIYFVDDKPELVQIGLRRLVTLGYEVKGFNEPLAALESIAADPLGCDLLITDYSMPGMSGLALARSALLISTELPVLLMTGGTESLARENLAAAGVHRVLMKPFTATELASNVQALLAEGSGRKRGRRARASDRPGPGD